MKAASLLCDGGHRRILDVGSGCGKFCLVGALSSQGEFTGIEQRSNLSLVATENAEALKAKSANFIHGNAFDLDWSSFDAFYFFNPFYELKEWDRRIDQTLDGKTELDFVRYVREATHRLVKAKAGTRIVTYHGYGGAPPSGFYLSKTIPIGTDSLSLWVKA